MFLSIRHVARLALVVGLGVLAPRTALADEGPLVTCVGVEQSTYSPGLLLLTPRDVLFEGRIDYTSCPVSDGVVTSAVYVESVVLKNATCTAAPSLSTATVAWSNQEVSTLSILGVEANVVGNLQVYTSVGTVTSGRYSGKLVNLVVAIPILDQLAACLSPQGLTTLNGLSTLTVLGL
ncbi:hypothetical protein OWM54_01880 [Myxococcus sp. MISCRS1]|uniref:hypothetical protein n=1 Tax=Myxococcus sp. MISCRS1 TaxID=2996786 RepID=UPI00226FBEF4|nr:hypothetical protein [Myxococcus sp. MISCRS1]MCY0995881.1 hypothetical protein [Myxococcus sp. MISCRS1]